MSAKSERLVLIGSNGMDRKISSSLEEFRAMNKPTSFCICDATSPDFFAGRNLPGDWVRDLENGPWCFLPLDSFDEPYYGGNYISELRKFPISYSTGFASREEALEACKVWMDKIGAKNTRVLDWEVYQSLTEDEEPEYEFFCFCDNNDDICYCGQK